MPRAIPPLLRARPAARGPRRRFTEDSLLDATVLRMIALNSLAAFTQDVTRTAGLGGAGAIGPSRPTAPVAPPDAVGLAAAGASQPQNRTLGTLPATPPTGPVPRGSLLDLRV